MNITHDFKNSLLNRREVSFTSTNVGNPGFAAVSKKVGEHFKVDEGLVVVKEVQGKFGTDQYSAKVYVYHSLKDKESFEPKKKIKVKKEGAT
jgi:ribosomal protein S24E